MAFQIPTSFSEQKDLFQKLQKTGFTDNTNFRNLANTLARINVESDITFRDRLISEFQGLFKKELEGNIIPELDRAKQRVEQKLVDYANKTDFSTLSPEQVQKELGPLINGQMEGDLGTMEKNISFLKAFGEDTSGLEQGLTSLKDRVTQPASELSGTQFIPEGSIRTNSGFISSKEGEQLRNLEAERNRTVGRSGEPVVIRPLPGGGFGVFGTQTGKQFNELPLNSEGDANAFATTIQSGGVPTFDDGTGRSAIKSTQEMTPEEMQNLQGTKPETLQPPQPGQFKDNSDYQRALDQFQRLGHWALEPGLFQTPTLQAGADGTTGANADASASASAQVASGLEQGVQAREQEALGQDSNLTITPEMRATWLQESYDELRNNRYYQEVIRNTEFDLGTSLNRLIGDTRLREISLVQDYKENLRGTQQSLQDRGLLFGEVRQGEERELSDKTNMQLQAQETQFMRGLQDISKTGERTFGSDYAATLVPKFGTTETVGRVIEGSPVFSTGATTQAFTPMGGNYGSLPRELEGEARYRAGEKETAFRDITSEYA